MIENLAGAVAERSRIRPSPAFQLTTGPEAAGSPSTTTTTFSDSAERAVTASTSCAGSCNAGQQGAKKQQGAHRQLTLTAPSGPLAAVDAMCAATVWVNSVTAADQWAWTSSRSSCPASNGASTSCAVRTASPATLNDGHSRLRGSQA